MHNVIDSIALRGMFIALAIFLHIINWFLSLMLDSILIVTACFENDK
jgi:hypothetical protein